MRKIIYAALVLTAGVLAGCLDITEEIFLEKNGSGRYTSTIDMRQMKDMISLFRTMVPDSAKDDEKAEFADLDSLQNMWKDLESTPGVSEVKREKKEEWVYVISFRFANTNALNEAMTKRKKPEEQQQSGNFYSFSPGTFACNDTSLAGMNDILKGADPAATNDSTQSDSTLMAVNMMKGFLGDMKYTSIYHLPGKVQSFTNKKAKLSDDGKTLTLSINLTDETDTGKTLVNQIKYKK